MRIKTALSFLTLCLITTQSSLPTYAATTGNKPRWRNNLPPTVLDSFVYEAHEHREHIYGDEGKDGLPPYMSFTKVHRINTGIMDERDKGLTTGHGSYLPCAWGADEFLMPPDGEWSQSGSTGRSRAQGFVEGLPNILPDDVRTGTPPPPPPNRQLASGFDTSGMGGNDAPPQEDPGSQLPPPPGEGYFGVYQHGMFVGYIAPGEDMLDFVRSDRYLGGNMGRKSIEYQLGARSSPF